MLAAAGGVGACASLTPVSTRASVQRISAKGFTAHPNQVLSRERILNLATRNDLDPYDRSVDLRVLRLRRKIEPDPTQPRYLRSVRSEGYVFLPDGGKGKGKGARF